MRAKVCELIMILLGVLQEEKTLKEIDIIVDEYMSFAEDDIHTFNEKELQSDIEWYVMHYVD